MTIFAYNKYREMSMKRFFFSILAIIAIVAPLSGQTLEQDIEKCLNDHGAIGLACVAVKDGKIIWAGEFGHKDLGGAPFSGEHNEIFRIASVSKSFGATSIMQLVEAGRMSLDDDAQKYLPFPLRHPDHPDVVITVRMLLNHTSSIAHPDYKTLDVIDPAKNPQWQDCYHDWKPGTKYKYSNLGYNLIAAIIENVSGERFDVYVKKHICDPLGMNASFNVDDLDRNLMVPIYRWSKNKERFICTDKTAYKGIGKPYPDYVIGYDAALFSGAGGMKTSAVDLAKYMIMHMNLGEYEGVRIISQESARQMQTYSVSTGKNGAYGFGLRSKDNWVDGKTVGGHTGGALGLHSIMTFVPQEHWGTVNIVNGCRNDAGLLKELDNILYKYLIK